MFTTDKPSILAMPRVTLALWLGAFIVASTGLTWYYEPDWSLLHVLVGGVLMGTMSFYMLFINRILVS
ncbi:MAG: hypothetical protein H6738_04080 [Alphaproteobacteria bacterium]|nr:hypothetical protein [Alphaproteobacteria bacterium]MCB9695949.1 hypothetical protein [Alphaproteobacteria bacterium]